MRRRVRVRVAPEDQPRGPNRTPRKLTNRSIKKTYVGSWGTSSRRGADGMSSIHFEFVPRGFASNKGRSWRAGEAERACLYMTTYESLEDGELGWHSNVAGDRNELRSFWRALEAIERHDRANANVYIVEVIELPCEASPRLRRKIVKRIVARLEKRGLAYVAAIHKPDRGGDQRNFHLHLMYSLRPSARIAAYDWAFGMSKVADINTKDGIRERRRCVVRDVNASLHAAHIAKRYTALSNAARGLEPPTQTKVGQTKTWAKRSLLAAAQKVDDIHRLLAIAADLRATVERVQRALRQAEKRVVYELRRKAREISEREGQRAIVLSEMAGRVDQAKTALLIKQHSVRLSAAFEEMFAESTLVSPIAAVPVVSGSEDSRTTFSVASKLGQKLSRPLTEVVPAAVKSAPGPSTQGKDMGTQFDMTNRLRPTDVPVHSDKAPEEPRFRSLQGRAVTPHSQTTGEKVSEKNHEAIVREIENAKSERNALQPSLKVVKIAAQGRGVKPSGPIAGELASSTTDLAMDDAQLRNRSTVSAEKPMKEMMQFAAKAENASDDKLPSRHRPPGRGPEKPPSREALAEIMGKKLRARVGAKREDSLNLRLVRQAVVNRDHMVSDKTRAHKARPADDLPPTEFRGAKIPTAPTPDKTITEFARTLLTNSEPQGPSIGESGIEKGWLNRKPAAEPPSSLQKEPDGKRSAKGAPPERVFSKGKVSPTEEGWPSSNKGRER